MLVTGGGADDRDRAEELLGAAFATCRELGMERHLARASAATPTRITGRLRSE